ncbi:hypothetical protein X813_gp42 [Lactobacillus phage LL-Ku]|uniref:Uncharacterized protein n=1 Tax=Lactobacillus phage LL-Ku TaxID=2892343 RepID=F7V9E2_9CAUD|nr:hypothetical protein X813_gp42 [Lactobacillus phage LL-Ku]AAV30203.1 hypothetical protein [Lactobacillus phage LL-Ku]
MVGTLVTVAITASWSCLILSVIALILKPSWLTGFAFLGFMGCAFWSMALIY